jgi:hypothetical protein
VSVFPSLAFIRLGERRPCLTLIRWEQSVPSTCRPADAADSHTRTRTSWEGQVRICRVDAEGSLAKDRGKQLCVLAVPTFMTIPDLCRFIGQVRV